ncbi:hypothetical protein [Streptomyces bobili]|uniref:hypothetical protein n=1 Tax=Streptomyces bobili TaxID=67280 RepID=UPI003F5F4E74
MERFFRTLREGLLEVLPGYKGPDIHSRGELPEGDAFFFLDELEAIIREWTATVYHCRPHSSLVDPGLPGLRMSPAQMLEHGMARAGYIDVPRDPDLAFEFLATKWRTVQHYGVEIDRRRYRGLGLPAPGIRSPYEGPVKNGWPFQIDPDDITRIYFRDPATRVWHTLTWEHAPVAGMPLSEDALVFARKLAAAKYRYPDNRLAVADLLERWNAGTWGWAPRSPNGAWPCACPASKPPSTCRAPANRSPPLCRPSAEHWATTHGRPEPRCPGRPSRWAMTTRPTLIRWMRTTSTPMPWTTCERPCGPPGSGESGFVAEGGLPSVRRLAPPHPARDAEPQRA